MMISDTIETTLGIPLQKEDTYFTIDISELRVFTGLSVVARILGDQVIEILENHPGDVAFLYKINPNINPELIDMNVKYIQFYSKRGVLDNVLTFKDEFQEHLRSVFGTFQRPIWGSIIHPEYYKNNHETSRALLFPFHHHSENEDIDYVFLLERVEQKKGSEDYFFRLTVENYKDFKYEDGNHSFIEVDDLKNRVYIEGSSKLADSISEKIQISSKKGHFQYIEDNTIQSHIFEQLSNTGIGKIEQVSFIWDAKFSKFIQNAERNIRISSIKKLFLTFEDSVVTSLLKKGEVVRVKIGGFYTYVYMTRLSKVLNISVNIQKKSLNLEHYLKRMPYLEMVANKVEKSLDFTGIKIFLIHHITSEILALIEVFRRLNSDELNVMFVKYGGVVPSAYLDVLLEIPTETFFSTGLVKSTTEMKKDYYTLSMSYSNVKQHGKLAQYLEENKLPFYDAMKFLSCYFFLLYCEKARGENKKVLIIEDGGYISPVFQEMALSDISTIEVFEMFLLSTEFKGKFSEYFSERVYGSVEHTRNGYDRLKKVIQNKGKLFLPTYSIAISNNKVREESQEVAHSILSAIESILHGQGLVLSRRKTIVLGSKGNIGTFLTTYLEKGRLHSTNLEMLKVDLKYAELEKNNLCYKSLYEIPESLFLDCELFIGVIGESILKKDMIEKLILEGNKKKIFFASGSTKTAEFSDLILFLNELSLSKEPTISGFRVELQFERIKDPQSNIDQGGMVYITVEKGSKKIEKIFFLLGDLTPINFLFYGVPTETMDMIIRQLTTISLGLTDQYRRNVIPQANLYAVDKEIDEWGNLI